MNAILLDPRTGGMAGDMLCAALADLTGSAEPLHALADAIAALPRCSVFDISLERVEKPFSAAFLSITLEEELGQSDDDIAHEMGVVIDKIGLSPPATAMAHAILGDLVSVKNRIRPQEVSGHTLASVDTIFYILGPLALLEDARLFGCPVYTPPRPLEGG